VAGVPLLGDQLGEARFVVLLACVFAKAERQGAEVVGTVLARQGRDGRRVQPSRQEDPDGHIGDEVVAQAVDQGLAQLVLAGAGLG